MGTDLRLLFLGWETTERLSDLAGLSERGTRLLLAKRFLAYLHANEKVPCDGAVFISQIT